MKRLSSLPSLLLLCLFGCGGNQQASSPMPAPVAQGGNPTPATTDSTGKTTPTKDPQTPAQDPSPSSGAVSFQDLVKDLPEDLRPKHGEDELASRRLAKEWLAMNAAGKFVEFSADVVGAEKEPNPGSKPTVQLTVRPVGQSVPTKKLSDGLRVGTVKIGDLAVKTYVSVAWVNADAATVAKLEALKNNTVLFRGKIAVAEFGNTETGGDVGFNLSLDETTPIQVKETMIADNGGRPNPARPPTKDYTAGFPKPIDAKDLSIAALDPELVEELTPADDFFPRCKLLTPNKDGKPHGDVRRLGPQRRLIVLDRYADGLLKERWSFFPSGKAYSHFDYSAGKPHGLGVTWFEDGRPAYLQTWVDGHQTGPTVMFSLLTNKPAVVSNYIDGVVQGERFHYLPDGRLFGVSTFEGGKEIDQKHLLEPTEVDFANIRARERYSKQVLKDFWTPNHIVAEREKGNAPPDPNKNIGQWVALFDGKNLNGWWPSQGSEAQVKWEVEGGLLVGSGAGRMGYLYRDEDDYENFRLRAEVRINDVGNSGLMIRGKSEETFDTGWPGGIEVQIALADKQMKTGGLFANNIQWESKKRPSGAGVKEGKPAPKTKLGSTNEIHHQADEWFTMEVTIKGTDVSSTINGQTTADDSFIPKPEVVPAKGFIGLQVHPRGPTTVAFKKIEVMRLTPVAE